MAKWFPTRRPIALQDWVDWVDAGRPALSDKQLRAASRDVARMFGKPAEEVVALAMSARQAFKLGAPEQEVRIMAEPGTDPELRTMWLAQLGVEEHSQAVTLAAGVDPQEAAIMLSAEVDPELRTMWLEQLGDRAPAPATPLAMDPERYQLHQAAKQLAEQKLARNPRLDDAEAYILATLEIEDRKFLGPI